MEKTGSNKLLLPIISIFVFSFAAFSQDFTWVNGSTFTNQSGVYPIVMGTSSTTYNPGGREGAVSWKDNSGNFWLFGGLGYDAVNNMGRLNDLWKYNLVTNEWTWVKGDNVIEQVGVYGTQGVAAPGNEPGSRMYAVSWADASGNLWLFGGNGIDGAPNIGELNDLWKYNITSNQWTWVSGSNTVDQLSNYGTQGVAAPSNIPGARHGSAGWKDAAGNLWLMGGYGNATTTLSPGQLNDLWKYSISGNVWTWVKGSITTGQNGTYGVQGTAAPINNPGGRSFSTTWVDAQGNAWLFGGQGFDVSSALSGYLNDLWRYTSATNEWTWMKGGNAMNQTGVYGSPGVPAPTNMPGGRFGALGWIDAVGNMWLSQGEGMPSVGGAGLLNDLWKYNMTSFEWTWIRGSSNTNQFGIYGTQGFPSFTNSSGARRRSVGWMDGSNNMWWFGGKGNATPSNNGYLSDLWKYQNCYISPLTLTVTSKDSVVCAGETTSLTVVGSDNYLWVNTFSTTAYIVITPSTNTTYTVITSGVNNCKYLAAFTQTVLACVGIADVAAESNVTHLFPNPNNGEFYFRSLAFSPGESLTITNAVGQKVFEKNLTGEETQIQTSLPAGIYYCRLVNGNRTVNTVKLLIGLR